MTLPQRDLTVLSDSQHTLEAGSSAASRTVQSSRRPSAELSVIIPTFNERENIPLVLAALERALAGVSWEVVFVDDDSRDGTVEYVRNLARQDSAVRVLHRIGRRGLASACVEGMMATAAPYLAVMDADLQHDSRLLPQMLEALRERPYDLVCGSRYMTGGSAGDWASVRQKMSRFATAVCKWLLDVNVTDPMSGFFMVRRDYFDRVVRNLSPQGFKILVDLVTASRDGQVSVLELSYRFGTRQHGESKLDFLVVIEFGLMLLKRRLSPIPLRFLQFVGVGSVGAVGHIAVLWSLLRLTGGRFLLAQASATVIAMTVNFVLNNVFTYRHARLVGFQFVRGLLTFYVACALGAAANLAIAQRLYQAGISWWFAGLLGAIVGSIWNFAITSTFTWKQRS